MERGVDRFRLHCHCNCSFRQRAMSSTASRLGSAWWSPVLLAIENLSVKLGGLRRLHQPLIHEAHLIPDRHLPRGGIAQLGEVLVDHQRVQVIAFLVELIGDLVAGALLPIDPVSGPGRGARLLGFEQHQAPVASPRGAAQFSSMSRRAGSALPRSPGFRGYWAMKASA